LIDSIQKIQLFTKKKKNVINSASYQGRTKAVPRLHHPRSFLASSFSLDFAFFTKKKQIGFTPKRQNPVF